MLVCVFVCMMIVCVCVCECAPHSLYIQYTIDYLFMCIICRWYAYKAAEKISDVNRKSMSELSRQGSAFPSASAYCWMSTFILNPHVRLLFGLDWSVFLPKKNLGINTSMYQLQHWFVRNFLADFFLIGFWPSGRTYRATVWQSH